MSTHFILYKNKMWYYCQYETTFHKRPIDTKEITAIGHCQVFNNDKNCYGLVN